MIPLFLFKQHKRKNQMKKIIGHVGVDAGMIMVGQLPRAKATGLAVSNKVKNSI